MPSKSAPTAPSARTRTPSDLKWLLNERAALVGRLEYQHQETAKLNLRVAEAKAVLHRSLAQLTELATWTAATEAKIRALDRTVALGYPHVPPDAAGSVKEHARFGPRGALISFLLQEVSDASPAGLSTTQLTDLVRNRFSIPVADGREREALRHTVRNQLRKLRDLHGLVLDAKGPQSNSHSTWRLRPSATLSELQLLAAQAAAAEAADERDAHPDAL